jgi:hypothetical protein
MLLPTPLKLVTIVKQIQSHLVYQLLQLNYNMYNTLAAAFIYTSYNAMQQKCYIGPDGYPMVQH